MEEGSVLSLQFTAFDVEVNGSSCIDSVTVTDGDGKTLLDETCGGSTNGHLVIAGQSKGSLLPKIKSMSNVVMITFTTGDSYTMAGWSVTWSAIPTTTGALGLPPLKKSLIFVFLSFCML